MVSKYQGTSQKCFSILTCLYVALFGMDGIDGDGRTAHFIQSDDDDESTSTEGNLSLCVHILSTQMQTRTRGIHIPTHTCTHVQRHMSHCVFKLCVYQLL